VETWWNFVSPYNVCLQRKGQQLLLNQLRYRAHSHGPHESSSLGISLAGVLTVESVARSSGP